MYEIKELTPFIETAGIATLGTSLFLYHAPAQVDTCVILFPSADPPRINPETPSYLHGKFQTIVRAATYEEGFDICNQLSASLTFYNKETPNIKIKQCRPLYQPRVYRRSEGGSLEFSITYVMHYIQK